MTQPSAHADQVLVQLVQMKVPDDLDALIPMIYNRQVCNSISCFTFLT